MTSPPISLVELLVQDQHKLKRARGGEYKTLCWLHTDTNPSMSIDDVAGVFYCSGCSAKGNAYNYLVNYRKMTNDQAVAFLGWSDKRIKLNKESQDAALARLANTMPEKKPTLHKKISTSNWDKGTLVAQYDYMRDGRLFCSVAKYDVGRRTLPFTPVEGGYYCCWPTSDKIQPKDRAKKLILFNLDLLNDLPVSKGWQVWVVEGEKNVVSVNSIYPSKVVVSAPSERQMRRYGESMALSDNVDWSPLYGHRLLLMSGASEESRNYMRMLGKHLHNQHCEVRLVLPSGDDKYDISGVINTGRSEGDVNKAVEKWVNSCNIIDVQTIINSDSEAIQVPDSSLAKTNHYEVLGLGDDKQIWFRLFATEEIMHFNRAELSDLRKLNIIAPLEFWYELVGSTSFNQKHGIQIASRLLRCAEKMGVVHMENIMDIGAAMGKDKLYYHLGNRVLFCDVGASKMVDHRRISEISDVIFRPRKSVALVDRDDADVLCSTFSEAISKYRWDAPTSCRVFVGWIVCAIVGGALDWRPNVWMLAGSNVGKSTLLEYFVQPIIRGLGQIHLDPTEAGLVQTIKSASIPVILDEFEAGEGGVGVDRFRGILKLVRYACSDAGTVSRGSPTGHARAENTRFSVLAASISRLADMAEQDENRFAFIRLSPIPVANYKAKESAILDAISGDKAAAIRTHIIRSTPRIVRRVKQLERHSALEGHSVRDRLILAALSAGWQFLSGNHKEIITVRDSAKVDLTAPTQNTVTKVLEAVLTARVPYPGKAKNITVASALNGGFGFVQEYGVRLYGEATGGNGLVMAVSTSPFRALLKGTPWFNSDLREMFRGVRDIKSVGKTMRFGSMTSRPLYIPEEMLNEAGFHSTLDLQALAQVKEQHWEHSPEDGDDDDNLDLGDRIFND